MDVNCQLHAPAALHPLDIRLGGPQSRPGRREESCKPYYQHCCYNLLLLFIEGKSISYFGIERQNKWGRIVGSFFNENRTKAVNPTLFSGGTQIRSRLGHELSWLKYCVVFRNPSTQIMGYYTEIAQDWFHLNHFQFTIWGHIISCWQCR
jgi:hypothetical protein